MNPQRQSNAQPAPASVASVALACGGPRCMLFARADVVRGCMLSLRRDPGIIRGLVLRVSRLFSHWLSLGASRCCQSRVCCILGLCCRGALARRSRASRLSCNKTQHYHNPMIHDDLQHATISSNHDADPVQAQALLLIVVSRLPLLACFISFFHLPRTASATRALRPRGSLV